MALISMDGKFMKFMDRFVDVLVLNVLWLVFCLPIVTIGASTTAAFSVALRLVDEEEGPLFRDFWRAFRQNFRRATGLWLLHAVALYAVYLDVQIVTSTPDPSIPLLVVGIVSAVFVFCAFIYAYPLLARYDTTVRAALQNSLRISVQHVGRTLLLVVVLGVEIAVFSWNTTMLFLGLLVGPMILMYTLSGMAKRLFQSLEASS